MGYVRKDALAESEHFVPRNLNLSRCRMFWSLLAEFGVAIGYCGDRSDTKCLYAKDGHIPRLLTPRLQLPAPIRPIVFPVRHLIVRIRFASSAASQQDRESEHICAVNLNRI